MVGHLPYTTLRQGIFTHPTVAEGLTALLANVPAPATGRPLKNLPSDVSTSGALVVTKGD